MLQDRINRVINNHQLSCEHRSHYLYILAGFNIILDKVNVPVDNLDIKRLDEGKNYYIKYEEAMTLGDGFIQDLKDNHYDIWFVNFNLFDGGFLSKRELTDYTDCSQLCDYQLVTYPKLSWADEKKTISIFNTENPLEGFVDNPDVPRSNEERLTLLLEKI